MRTRILPSVCAFGLLVGAGTAFAGAYGEPVDPEETPAPPPAPPAAMVIEEEPDYARVGPYIGVGGNFAFNNFDGLDSDATSSPGGVPIVPRDSIDNSGGFHVRGGYRVHPNVAVELRYERYTRFETDPGPGHLSGWALSGNVKGFFTTGRVQPYAVFGMGYLDMNSPGVDQADEIAGDDFAMRFGLGMDANITENIAMGPEVAYVLPVGDASDLDLITLGLGLQYKF